MAKQNRDGQRGKLAIRRGDGKITGHIDAVWSASHALWLSIPEDDQDEASVMLTCSARWNGQPMAVRS